MAADIHTHARAHMRMFSLLSCPPPACVCSSCLAASLLLLSSIPVSLCSSGAGPARRRKISVRSSKVPPPHTHPRGGRAGAGGWGGGGAALFCVFLTLHPVVILHLRDDRDLHPSAAGCSAPGNRELSLVAGRPVEQAHSRRCAATGWQQPPASICPCLTETRRCKLQLVIYNYVLDLLCCLSVHRCPAGSRCSAHGQSQLAHSTDAACSVASSGAPSIVPAWRVRLPRSFRARPPRGKGSRGISPLVPKAAPILTFRARPPAGRRPGSLVLPAGAYGPGGERVGLAGRRVRCTYQ